MVLRSIVFVGMCKSLRVNTPTIPNKKVIKFHLSKICRLIVAFPTSFSDNINEILENKINKNKHKYY